MKQEIRNFAIGAAGVLAIVVAFNLLGLIGWSNEQVWKRENPLISAVAVTGVHGGIVTLADGRAFRPAGVSKSSNVTPENYDEALRVIVAQGVVVTRDLGDGSALLLAEPKFYNWCGTSSKRWAGSYLQCPVSELLIHTANATVAFDATGLTARERWRLEGVEHLVGIEPSPTRISGDLRALRFTGSATAFSEYDVMLELIWKPAPLP